MENSFHDLKQAFASSKISKAEFIALAHQRFHSILFQYANELSLTDIARIEVVDNLVVMTSRTDHIKISVDPADHRTAPIEALNFNQYEPAETSIIRKLASKIDAMLDIGANIGWYSLLVAAISPSAEIHAFEPIPATYRRLIENCALNNLESIHCYNYGFSVEAGSFPFWFYPQGSGNASMRNLAARPDVEVIECELRTLTQFYEEVQDIGRIDFIKCDVEGNELFVLQGGQSVLQLHKPIILLELLRKWSAPFGYHPNDVFSYLAELGYSAYVVSGEGSLSLVTSISDDTLETNFFFVHPASRLRSSLEL